MGGVFSGVVGLAAKPVAGMLGGVSEVATGVAATTAWAAGKEDKKRVREQPRQIVASTADTNGWGVESKVV